MTNREFWLLPGVAGGEPTKEWNCCVCCGGEGCLCVKKGEDWGAGDGGARMGEGSRMLCGGDGEDEDEGGEGISLISNGSRGSRINRIPL